MKRHLTLVWAVGAALLVAAAAHAQTNGAAAATNTGYQPRSMVEAIVSTLVFSLIGIVLAVVGFKLFDMVIPFDVEREICEKNNIAAAILAGAMVLGICLIVGFVVIS
ncbi:MAG: DUF350 domain-containing protein [Armatimonadota bacterium]